MILIRGKVQRKIQLSFIEKMHSEIEDKPFFITFRYEDITHTEDLEQEKVRVSIKNPPFPDDEFYLIATSKDIIEAMKKAGKQIIKDSIIINGNAKESKITLKNKEVTLPKESKSVGYYFWKVIQVLIPLGILIFAYLNYNRGN